jgi:hypothetical protein
MLGTNRVDRTVVGGALLPNLVSERVSEQASI